MMLQPGLYVVATPIGNLEDISLRAIRVLSEAACIAAEDTRHSGVLLRHLDIDAELVSVHEHNEAQRVPGLVRRIREGQAVALISDAGTPLVSDPGFRLVRAVGDAGLPVFTVPGASAVTAALSVSGLATDRFRFEGFPPSRQAARAKKFRELANEDATLVFFESSHRVAAMLADAAEAWGPDREAAICRELTKKFETVRRGSLASLCHLLQEDPDQRKGEFVIVVAGSDEPRETVDALALARALREHLSASQAARIAANITGASRRDLYKALEDS